MSSARPPRRSRYALAALSAGAGVAHASVIVEHAGVAWWYGGAFASVAVLQIAWAGLLLARSPRQRVLLAGAAGHAVVLAAWAVARTLGLPFVSTGSPAPVGYLDGTTAVFQGLIVVGVLIGASATLQVRPRLQQAMGAAAAVVVLLTAPVTAAALAVGPGHTHDSDSSHDAAHDHGPDDEPHEH
jgi:hypothetical protein